MPQQVDMAWTPWLETVEQPQFHQYWFEKIDRKYWYEFGDNYMLTLIAFFVGFYLVCIWWLKNFMKNRKPMPLRVPMFLWNTLVGFYSTIVSVRIGLEVYTTWRGPHGFHGVICLREGLHMSTTFWTVITMWTKPLFMLDTIFLICRKKPVDAMHIFHHTIAIVLAPILVQSGEPFSRVLMLLNAFTHAIDYSLLALRSLKIHLPMSRQLMVALEIVQVTLALLLSAYTIFLQYTGIYCIRFRGSIAFTYFTYLSILVLVLATIAQPGYWERGQKKNQHKTSSTEKLKSA